MSTGLYLSDTADLLTRAHGQVLAAVATHPSLPNPVPLHVIDWSITWDETTAPRVTGTITVAEPDQDVMDLLDPRTGVRVDLAAGYVRSGDVEDAAPFADLGVRNREHDVAARTVDLTLASDEALVIDASASVTGSRTGTPQAIITALIKSTISPQPRITVSGPAGTSTTVDPITDVWDTVADLADRIEAKAFDDGSRAWVVAPMPYVSTVADHALTIGSAGTVVEAADILDRDTWHNYVTLRYRWRTAAGVDMQVLATATVAEGPWSITGPAGKRAVIYDREVPTTQSQANKAAKAVLSRALTRANRVSITAVSALWLRPGHTVTVTLRDGSTVPYLVSRVNFGGDGTMRIDGRAPEVITAESIVTTTPDGSAPTPDPAPAATQTYVSTWLANNSKGYKGNGTQRPDSELAQGSTPFFPSNGNSRSLLLFTAANSTGDETGVTITTALAGARIIKVELSLTAIHWHSYSGGYACIGKANVISIPTSLGSASPYVTTSKWGLSTRLINVTSSALSTDLLSGACRAITIGPGASTSTDYYGKFANHAASSGKPFLRITYAK